MTGPLHILKENITLISEIIEYLCVVVALSCISKIVNNVLFPTVGEWEHLEMLNLTLPLVGEWGHSEMLNLTLPLVGHEGCSLLIFF